MDKTCTCVSMWHFHHLLAFQRPLVGQSKPSVLSLHLFLTLSPLVLWLDNTFLQFVCQQQAQPEHSLNTTHVQLANDFEYRELGYDRLFPVIIVQAHELATMCVCVWGGGWLAGCLVGSIGRNRLPVFAGMIRKFFYTNRLFWRMRSLPACVCSLALCCLIHELIWIFSGKQEKLKRN